MSPRLLFASYHCPFDPSSGAALCTRDLLVLLAEAGWPCAVFAGPNLDFDVPTALPDVLGRQKIAVREVAEQAGQQRFRLYRGEADGISYTLFAPDDGLSNRPATPLQGQTFLACLQRALHEFRPEAVLTYGGRLAEKIIATAKRHGAKVVFALHNFAYTDAGLFRDVDAVLVPSRFAAEHYRRTLGLECTAIPGPWDWRRVVWERASFCTVSPLTPGPSPQRGEGEGVGYVTFVNPRPEKGATVFARIAHELGRRRPDIPFLVVEGRGRREELARSGLDLATAGNLFVMANTPDPRDFYRVSRIILMPSLWWESFGRVSAEALMNGIPVLASDRGGNPEVLAEAGFLFDIPARYTPESNEVPTAAEGAPWIATILRLWDDAAFYAREQARCRAAAEAWRPERLLPRFAELFARLVRRG